MNRLIQGDNLDILSDIANVDLIYIDPPFATGRDFGAYTDFKQGSEYLDYLRPRLLAAYHSLSDNGVFCLHVDHRTAYKIRFVLDSIFGESNFINEIVWWYYNKMQGNIGRFANNHDTILVYSKSSDFTFNPQKQKRPEKVRQLSRVWDTSRNKLVNEKNEFGVNVYSDSEYSILGDVLMIPMLPPISSEKTGYPWQKPEELVSVFINAFSNPGDLVLDCFSGSGTTLICAEKSSRRWIGIDLGSEAIETSSSRIHNLDLHLPFQVVTSKGIEEFPGKLSTLDIFSMDMGND